MALIFRSFQSRPGRAAELIASLHHAASAALQSRTGSVVLCRTQDPREVIWIGQHAAEPDLGPLSLPAILDDSLEGILAECSPPFSLRFLDGWYRLPAPPYQVWNLAVHAPGEGPRDTLKDVFELSREQGRDPHVVGRALYRAVEDPSLLVGFVSLARSWLARNDVARMIEGIERVVVWRPLSLVCQVERVADGVLRTREGEEAARARGWGLSDILPVASVALDVDEGAPGVVHDGASAVNRAAIRPALDARKRAG